MLVKLDSSKPKAFCEHEKPTEFYPAVAFSTLKVKARLDLV